MNITPEYPQCWTEYLAHLGKLTPKENTMDNMEQTQRRYMDSRTYQLTNELDIDLMKQFGTYSEDTPSNAKELVQRIQDGKFVLPENSEDNEFCCDSVIYTIQWRDPSVKQDREGLKKAREALRIEGTRIRDAISIQPYDKAVEAFEGFKTWKYTN